MGRLDELKTVLGVRVGPRVERAKSQLIAALAERDKGNREAAVLGVARAMGELATMGDELGAEEGALMRMVTAEFVKGLGRGDQAAVEENLNRIQSRAGTPEKRGNR